MPPFLATTYLIAQAPTDSQDLSDGSTNTPSATATSAASIASSSIPVAPASLSTLQSSDPGNTTSFYSPRGFDAHTTHMLLGSASVIALIGIVLSMYGARQSIDNKSVSLQ